MNYEIYKFIDGGNMDSLGQALPEEQARGRVILGHCELKLFNKFENGRMTTYGYGIHFDRDGKETGRTEPSAVGSIRWDNGVHLQNTTIRN